MKQFKVIILILLISMTVFGQINEFKVDSPKTDSFLKTLEKQGFNGAVLVSDGKTVFKDCYGFADKEAKIKCDVDSVYTVGSITKQFTGAAILKLEMMGKLSVQDKISKYFKDVPKDKQDITIHHLLTHSAGFPGGIGDDYDVVSRNEYVKLALATNLRFKPGTKYRYSNTGYSLAAAIIEKSSKMSYEEFLYKYLFKPAKMKKTGYSIPKWKAEKVAVGYRNGVRWGKTIEKPWGKDAPSWHLVGNGGILSTVGDMYKWHKALSGNKILNDSAKAKFYKRHIEEGEGAGSFYGYGWALFPTKRNTWLTAHNGGNGVFFADFWRFRDEKITIIMLTNEGRREIERIPSEIAKSIFDNKYQPKIEIIQDKKIKSLTSHPNADLISSFIQVSKSKDSETIKNFANDNFTEDFLKIAPIKEIVRVLSRIGTDITDIKIEFITIRGSQSFIKFTGQDRMLRFRFKEGKIDRFGY